MTWDKDALWSKSKGYVERALQEDRNNEMFPFWLSLSLELLARAAVSSIHPLLLAEPNKDDPTNILHALGRPTGKGKPKSLAISGVFKLCRHLVPGFTEEDLKICTALADLRNEELHSGAIAFAILPTASWLTHFYRAATALANVQGHTLEDFLGDEESAAATKMITADTDAVKAKVQKALHDHKRAFEAKSLDERRGLAEASAADAEQMAWDGGHRVACPSCDSKTYVTGESFSLKAPVLEDDEIVVRETMLPTALECHACGLRLTSHAELAEATLGAQYTRTARYDPLDFYAAEADGPEYDNE